MKKNFSAGNSKKKVNFTFDKEFSVSFWDVNSSRAIISEELDDDNLVSTKVSEINYIVYTSFMVSIVGKSPKEVKEVVERIERRLSDNEKGIV